MKHFLLLTPFIANIGIAMLLFVANNAESLHEGDTDIFYYPSVWGWFMIAGGILLQLFVNMADASGELERIEHNLAVLPVSLLLMNYGIYLLRYRVVVSSAKFTVGAFWKRTYSIGDIESTFEVGGRKAPQYFVYLKSGKKIRFSGLLCDYQRLVFSLPAPRGHHGHGA